MWPLESIGGVIDLAVLLIDSEDVLFYTESYVQAPQRATNFSLAGQ